MDRGFAVLIMAVVGGCIALQAPINSGLGKSTGSFAAATVSFAVGTVLLAAIVIASGKAGGLGNAAHVEWYYRRGGDGHRPAHDLGDPRPDRLPRPRPGAADGEQGGRRRPSPRGHLPDRSLAATRPRHLGAKGGARSDLSGAAARGRRSGGGVCGRR